MLNAVRLSDGVYMAKLSFMLSQSSSPAAMGYPTVTHRWARLAMPPTVLRIVGSSAGETPAATGEWYGSVTTSVVRWIWVFWQCDR